MKLLCLHHSYLQDDVLTGLNLPALESLDIVEFSFGESDVLQPDQLCCPQLSSLVFPYESRQEAQASEGGRQRCRFLHMPRLVALILMCDQDAATRTDLALPASLKQLTVQRTSGGVGADLKWVLLQAIKAIKSGVELRSLTCADSAPSSHPEGRPWGATSVAHYRELGEKLRGLKDLAVYGSAKTLLSAISALACSAADLTRLEFRVKEHPGAMELPPISSASLQSITGRFTGPRPLMGHKGLYILNLLPGCTQLHDVHVHFDHNMPKEGKSVKIRCHCTSKRCIVPLDACAGLDEVGVRFLPMPPSSQGLQAYTVIFTCQAVGPEQALEWCHVVMPGVW